MIFGILTGYADSTTFFVKNQTSAIEVLKVFDKLNKSKCEIAGICALKVVRVAHCSMQYINLNEKNVDILGIHFPYNQKSEEEKNFDSHI